MYHTMSLLNAMPVLNIHITHTGKSSYTLKTRVPHGYCGVVPQGYCATST
jgi:hypothetical protein